MTTLSLVKEFARTNTYNLLGFMKHNPYYGEGEVRQGARPGNTQKKS